jgi:hypothetical protein
MSQTLKKFHKPFILVAVMVSGFALTGCSDDNTTTKPIEKTSLIQPIVKIKATSVDPDTEWLNQFVQKNIIAPTGLREANFSWGKHDLNNNNKAEYLVIMKDMYFCGMNVVFISGAGILI